MDRSTFNLLKLPTKPGIYIYKDKTGKVIYIGKAINLKNRISQYFHRTDALGPKTQILVSQISTIDYKIVGSEIEALILEASYIKKYHPKYNSLLTDDRNYIYICITKEILPRIFSSFKSKISINSYIYGPFPSGQSVRLLLRIIRKNFPYRSIENHPSGNCLYCHLNLCPGPNPNITSYRHNIGKIKKILTGNFKLLQTQIKKELKHTIKTEMFELSILLRDQLAAIEYIVSGWHNLSSLYERINLPVDETFKALSEIYTVFHPYFPKLSIINRIECFDVSQLGNKYFVGAMSVFSNNHISKDQYRKFKIITKQSPDDQFMIKEIIYRRLNHPEWNFPEMIIVDGGKPQVSAANSILSTNSFTPYVIGLAKKNETIIFNNHHKWTEVNLPKNSSVLLLFQRLRNEAHRFANKYRKELINKTSLL